MPKLVANGVETNYQQAGEGPDLVMIHGLAANLAFWYLRIVPELAKHFRVTVYDLRGHGLSGMPDAGYTTSDLSRDLHGLCDLLELESFDLAGHSYGAAVALDFAAEHPSHVKSLSLFDCRVNSLQPIRGLDDHAYWEQRRAELESRGIHVPDGTPKILFELLADLAPLNEQGVAGGTAMPGLDGCSRWNPASRAARRWTKLVQTTTFPEDMKQTAGLTAQRISEIDVPALLSYGGNSRCLPTCRGLERALKQKHTIIHAGFGHYFPMIEPKLVIGDLHDFLLGERGSESPCSMPEVSARLLLP